MLKDPLLREGYPVDDASNLSPLEEAKITLGLYLDEKYEDHENGIDYKTYIALKTRVNNALTLTIISEVRAQINDLL